MATGLGSILTSSIDIVLEWSDKGEVRKTSDQKPAALFFDCSNHVDRNLRSLSEQSFEDFMRRINRFPVALMCLRLLDYTACNDPKIRKQQPVKSPFATEWINMLGSILRGTHEQSGHILYNFEQKTTALADKLRQEFPEISELLENADACPNPIWRMSEALSLLMGHKSLWANFNQCIDSSFFLGRPNGFAVKRRVRQTDSSIGPKTREIRSLIISDTALDYLVHLHVLNGKASSVRALSLKEFLRIIRHRYGFCVDEAPPGMSVSNDLLQMNRRTLEKRLRDLGLLEGVNDAEAMKRLTPRFELNTRETHATDH